MAAFDQQMREMDRRLSMVDPTLGEGAETDQNINIFKEWLINHGAKFDKIEWPSNETESGIRGAVAREDIETNEPMLYIPTSLMITPLNAFNDPVMGTIFREAQDVLRGDFLLTMFLSYELSKGEESFWYPYLRILPMPGSISSWSSADLNELQDTRIAHRAMNKRATLEAAYISIMQSLQQRFPIDLVSYDVFTYPRFHFSYNTIQARAFGRRLPWTALVPFADCLNHSNVQTKYDYNVDENQTFRLFPTGINSYRNGAEVFNSYGRRANDNLLLDYGFALPVNEWEEVTFHWKIPTTDNIGYQRLKISRSHGFAPLQRVVLHQRGLPLVNFSYFRIASLSESEIAVVTMSEDKCKLDNPWTLENEKNAITLFIHQINEVYRNHPTTEEEDASLLSTLSRSITERTGNPDTSPPWNLITAVTYRLLRKRILSLTLRGLNLILMWINSFILEKGKDSMKSDQNLRNDIRMTLQPFYTHDDDHSIEEMINYLIVLRSLEWTSSTESTGGEMR